MFLPVISRAFATDLAVDLGTSNTLVFVRGRGVVVQEPSMIATSGRDGTILATGRAAKAMLGRTPPAVSVVRPLRNGVIADLDLAQKMLAELIAAATRGWRSRFRPRVVVTIPSGITPVERRAVQDSTLRAGAREVYLVDAPLAAAIGAGLPVEGASGNLLVTVGGGTTQVAMLSLSGIVHCESVRGGGDDMDEAVIQWVRKHENLLIGERQAEAIKLALGSAHPTGTGRRLEVKGQYLADGLPRTIIVTDEGVAEALRDSVETIVDAVLACLEQIPPELSADIADKGIVLAGGGALLPGLADVLHRETELPVVVASDPLSCTALGAGTMLDRLGLLKSLAIRG